MCVCVCVHGTVHSLYGVCGEIRKDCKHFYILLVCGSLLCVIQYCLEVVKILTLTL